MTSIPFKEDWRGKRIWFDPKTLTILDGKQKGAFCFSSKCEYRLYLLLDELVKELGGDIWYEKPLIYPKDGEYKKWKVDFTLLINGKKYYVEFKSAFTLSRSKKFRREIRDIYQSLPFTAKGIIICSYDDIYVKLSETVLINAIKPEKVCYVIRERINKGI